MLVLKTGVLIMRLFFVFFQAEDGQRDLGRARGLGDVYKRQPLGRPELAPAFQVRLLHFRRRTNRRERIDIGNIRVARQGLERALSLIHI
mgnify:CR=1 FL=1